MQPSLMFKSKTTFRITIEKRRGSFKINTAERILWSCLSVHYDNSVDIYCLLRLVEAIFYFATTSGLLISTFLASPKGVYYVSRLTRIL